VEITGEHTFEAPIDQVWAMFRDRDAHVAKFEAMGHQHIEVLEYEADEDHTRVVIRRVVTLDLPGFAKKVLKPSNTMTTTDVWQANPDGTYGGTFVLDIPGAPVTSSGTTLLTPQGNRTHYVITVRYDVKVPLIGGKITDWAKGDVRKQIDQEFDAGDAWLAAR
jgi:hypothetical protein